MYIHVKVKAKAKKEEVIRISEDHFQISVCEPAQRNLANKRLLEIMRSVFSGRAVRLINGHNSPSKLLSIEDD